MRFLAPARLVSAVSVIFAIVAFAVPLAGFLDAYDIRIPIAAYAVLAAWNMAGPLFGLIEGRKMPAWPAIAAAWLPLGLFGFSVILAALAIFREFVTAPFIAAHGFAIATAAFVLIALAN